MKILDTIKKTISFLGLLVIKGFGLSLIVVLLSCEEFVKIAPPRTDLIKATVFTNDETAEAAVTGIYYQMSTFSGYASGSSASVSYLTAFSSDEYIGYVDYGGVEYQQFSDNELAPNNIFIVGLWADIYKSIYGANAILEGLTQNSGVTATLKDQLAGEAKFIRAFGHFYLVNLFGDIPLVTTTDYKINSTIGRTVADQVYGQIIADLKDSQNLLAADYSFSNNERVRANKAAATALLARTYLYLEDWSNAETESTKILENEMYSLAPDLGLVFKKNSSEAIMQFSTATRPRDFGTFRAFDDGPSQGALRDEFVNNFEPGDERFTNWIRSIIAYDVNYFYPGKYKSPIIQDEYSTVFRLAEIYLIRAEARAQLDKVSEARSDLNVIRARAGLGDTPANDKLSLLSAIERERTVELFTEHGHRWFDLKRTHKADAVLSLVKGNTWQATDVLYPIPENQILNDPGMKDSQNAGY